MNLTVLKTGLFPDANTLAAGLDQLNPGCTVTYFDATRDDLADDDWDQALAAILAAERFIVL